MKTLFLPDFRAGNPYQSELARGLEDLGVTVTFGSRRGRFPILRGFREQGGGDVLHLHWTAPFLIRENGVKTLLIGLRTLFELAILRARGVSLVWTVHNLLEHEQRHPILERAFTRVLAWLCSGIIVHCDAAGDSVADFLGLSARSRKRIHSVPHGDFLSAYPNTLTKESARSALGLRDDQRVFLYLGAVREYKGIPELIRAFGRLGESDLRLVIAGRPGSDSLRAEIDDLARRDPRVTVHWGFISDDKIQVFMNAADAVVLPYTDVLTSGAAILAISFGRPVVAPRLGCLPEALRGADLLLYNPLDSDGLRDALKGALTTELDTLGKAGRAILEDQGWKVVASRTLEVYRSATGATR